jgi:hypothetical protein
MQFFKKCVMFSVLMSTVLMNAKVEYSLDDADTYVHANVLKAKYGLVITDELVHQAKNERLTAAHFIELKKIDANVQMQHKAHNIELNKINADVQVQFNRQRTLQVTASCGAVVLVSVLCVIGANARCVESWFKAWRSGKNE